MSMQNAKEFAVTFYLLDAVYYSPDGTIIANCF